MSLGGERGLESLQTAPVSDEAAAAGLGEALAGRLLDDGAESILSEIRLGVAPLVPEP